LAIADGAKEIDMVINIGYLKSRKYDLVTKEIAAVKEACGDALLKVILETCLLTDEEKAEGCSCAIEGGADYVKTSTGFSLSGATARDVSVLCNLTKGKIKVKASGGMKSCEDMEMFLKLGAERLGTSSGVSLIKERMYSTK
ncbi:MAG: deoxyribose-phosphate aldolase, partial [Oscillospiraceae bacterium]